MNCYEKLVKIKRFTDSVGSIYGTEDFSIYLYSLIKMTRPKSVLELGTGFGTSSLWIALALEENAKGTLFTVDDGSEWEQLKSAQDRFGQYYNQDYKQYLSGLISEFGFENQIRFFNQTVTDFNFCEKYDIVFSDFSHGPHFILKLLGNILPLMEDNSFIFIDSASTYYPSFQVLESTIALLNAGKIPKTLEELTEHSVLDKLYEKVRTSKFELTHVIENKERNQNSTTQIKISPIDIMPQPRVNIRF